MTSTIHFSVNGRSVSLDTDPGRRLLWALRGQLALTGTKYGCGAGICGACTVLVDDRPVRACLTSLQDVAGRGVVTIEGLAHDGKLDALQAAFIDHGALQCGYCTAGMILTAKALLLTNPHPTRDAVAAALEHNLCRCGAHQRILDAVEAAAGTSGAPS